MIISEIILQLPPEYTDKQVIDFGRDIGLPPKTSYACLAETALLAMAGLRSFGKYITEEDVAQKRLLAEELRADAEKLAQVKRDSAEAPAKIPAISKGVGRSEGRFKKWALLGGSISAAMLGMFWLGRRRR